ncbi:MAG TPA: MFS transporter [Solirubrobacteraceae bacterium]
MSPESPRAQSSSGASRGLVLLLAVSCGAAVANLYYAQPLLHTLAHAFDVSEGTAGLLITITQVGYVVGLALLVPLGDLLERRRMIAVTLLLSAAALAVAAAAPGFTVFASAILIVGITSTVAQVIVPMSSSLASENQRGQVVGTVMSGLLVGILVARTVSGLVAAALGWRTVFAVGAVAMVALAAILHRALPEVPPTDEMSYTGLLESVLSLIREEPVLRRRMIIGAFTFGCFSTLWTSIAFLLSGAPYHYGNAVIGLIGLAGAAGAVAASVSGRLSDRGYGRRTTTVSLIIVLASWAVLAVGKTSLVAVIIGIAVLDLGVQSVHIGNQSAIYALRPEARSRLTTAYMVSFFSGGALLSAISTGVYASSGWIGVCVLGAVTAALALLFWAVSELTSRGRQSSSSRRPLTEGAGGTD